jgi:hypothetical protein
MFAATFAAVFVLLLPTAALAFREYTPPQCETAADPAAYRNCLYKIMQVESAEELRARDGIAYRLLNVTDSPAMPIFVEFARAAGQSPRLTIRSPDPDASPFITSIGEGRWRGIQERWRGYSARPKITERKPQTRGSNEFETVCIPQGRMDMEVVLRGGISRLSPDLCDADQMSFAAFLRAQAVEAAGACARETIGDVPDSRKLLRCLLHRSNSK